MLIRSLFFVGSLADGFVDCVHQLYQSLSAKIFNDIAVGQRIWQRLRTQGACHRTHEAPSTELRSLVVCHEQSRIEP